MSCANAESKLYESKKCTQSPKAKVRIFGLTLIMDGRSCLAHEAGWMDEVDDAVFGLCQFLKKRNQFETGNENKKESEARKKGLEYYSSNRLPTQERKVPAVSMKVQQPQNQILL